MTSTDSTELSPDDQTDVRTATDPEVVIEVTARAVEKVLEIRSAEPDPETLGLRVEVTGSGRRRLPVRPVARAAHGRGGGRLGRRARRSRASSSPPTPSTSSGAPRSTCPSAAGQGGLVIRNPNRPNPLAGLDLELQGTIAEKVQILLEQSINPSLAAHGGFATLVGVKEDTSDVYLTMGGGCQGCAMSRMTLTQGIQTAIKEAMPEVNEVVDVTDHAQGDNPFYS